MVQIFSTSTQIRTIWPYLARMLVPLLTGCHSVLDSCLLRCSGWFLLMGLLVLQMRTYKSKRIEGMNAAFALLYGVGAH